MILTQEEQRLLRTQPQSTDLHLAIWQPTIIFSCKVNSSSITKNAREIPYDTVSIGDYSLVKENMTLLVGSQPGLSDVGRIRIRSCDASQFIVAENSDILWEDELHLSVINLYEFWSILPRMIKNPSDDEEVIFYKDYDIPYTDQNSILGSFVCMGSHRAGNLEDGPHQEYYTATGTYNVAGSELQYFWEFEGGTPNTGTGMAPGWVTYNTAGDYTTKLTVTATNGGSDISYRYVKVEQIPSIKSWRMTRCGGSREEGETTCDIAIYEPAVVEPNSVVIIYSEDYYGNSKTSLGGNQKNGSHIFFVGYVKNGSIDYNFDKSSVTFIATSIVGLMKDTENFGVSLKYAATPTTWFEIASADLRASLYHYLRWHSTALSLCDVEFLGQSRNIQYFDTGRETIYDGLNNLLGSTIFGKVVCDRQGKLWLEVQAKAVDNAPTYFEKVLDVTEGDWMQTPRIQKNLSNPVSYVELNGIAFDGSTSLALIGCAPGVAPGVRGKAMRSSGLAVSSQAQLNRLCGNIYTWNNSKYPKINMTMNGNWRNLDLAPQEGYYFNIPASATPNNATITGTYTVEDLSWNFNDNYMNPQVGWSIISQNDLVGDTIILPVPPDVGTGIGGVTPPPPVLPPVEDPVDTDYSLRMVYVLVQDSVTEAFRVFACPDLLTSVVPTWTDITPLDAPMFVMPQFMTDWISGAIYARTESCIYRSVPTVDVNNNLVPQQMYQWILNTDLPVGGQDPSNNEIKSFGINPITGEAVAMLANVGAGIERFIYTGNINGFSSVSSFGEYSIWSEPVCTIGNGRVIVGWMHSTINSTFRVSDGGSWTTKNTTTFSGNASFPARSYHIRPNPTGDIVYHFSSKGGVAIASSSDLVDNSARVDNGLFSMDLLPDSFCGTFDGIKLVATNRLSPYRIRISADSGVNWSQPITDVDFVHATYGGTTSLLEDLFLALRAPVYTTTNNDIVYSVDHFSTYTSVGATLRSLLTTNEKMFKIAVVL